MTGCEPGKLYIIKLEALDSHDPLRIHQINCADVVATIRWPPSLPR